MTVAHLMFQAKFPSSLFSIVTWFRTRFLRSHSGCVRKHGGGEND